MIWTQRVSFVFSGVETVGATGQVAEARQYFQSGWANDISVIVPSDVARGLPNVVTQIAPSWRTCYQTAEDFPLNWRFSNKSGIFEDKR